MSTTSDLLLLHLAQAEQSLKQAKNNSYSDIRKQNYYNSLVTLFSRVQEESLRNLHSYSENDIYDGPQRYLTFIFKSLEFLDTSTLNQIPYETVACLELAMAESLDPTDKYIIVTSLINSFQGFSYDPSIAFDDNLYSAIEINYGIKFDYRLVQINVPKSVSRDYFASCVLYHELGHFVDMRLNLMKLLNLEFWDKIINNQFSLTEKQELLQFFPYLQEDLTQPPAPDQLIYKPYFYVTLSHFREYFCDLFAAQYIGMASGHYLSYLTRNTPRYSNTHPSTINRNIVVESYLNNNYNIIVDLINHLLNRVRNQGLIQKFNVVTTIDFFDLVPTTIANDNEMHGVIVAAWEIWLRNKQQMLEKLNTTDTLKLYAVLNNLIEKSIGNYITLKKWNGAIDRVSTLV